MKKIISLVVFALLLLPTLAYAEKDNKTEDVDKPHIQYIYHKVKQGESVYTIAKLYHAEIEEIYKLNPGSKERIWAGATLLVPSVGIESEETEEIDTLHIKEHLQDFIGEIYKITSINAETLEDMKAVDKKINSLDTKWNVYYQAKQANIADNDALMELVSKFQQLKQDAKDSLNAQKDHILLVYNFNKADKFIRSQLSIYQELSQQATEFSLAEALAPKLEELKTKEQLIFADIEKNYEIAKNAAAQNSSLGKRMNQITNNYVELKNYSEKIQAAEYKPFFERIKDYLFGLAAVTIILMFANMVQAKIKMYKQAKENAKKFEQFKKDDNEYPTI